MLLILPLMWHEWHVRGVDPQKLRVWLAMFGGSFVAWAIPELLPWIPGRHQLGLYVLLDIAVAGVILAKPRGLPQKSIGALSGVMVLFGVGYLISVLQGGSNPGMYGDVMSALGWARWGILFSWGAGDAVGMAIHRLRGDWVAVDRRAGAG